MYPCEIKTEAAQPILAVRFKTAVSDLPAQLGRIYSAIGAYLGELGEAPAGGVYAAYYNMDMQALDIEAGFSVTRPVPGKGEIQPGEIAAGTYAICHYTGAYEAMAPAYDALAQFAKANGCEPSSPVYEWYLNGPETPPQELKTDIVFPVTSIAEASVI